MNPFITLMPIYLLGNLHCAGMCGPLVMLLAKHPHRWAYFLGRTLSFSLAGACVAEAGVVLFAFLARYHISSLLTLLFGLWILVIGSTMMLKIRLPGTGWLVTRGQKLSIKLSKWMTQGSFFSIFLFGFATLALPCGQILIVYSIIALNCTPLMGLMQGCLFALLTSPSLIASMHAGRFFSKQHKNYHLWMGTASLLIGTLSCLRGLADWGCIPHCALEISSINLPVHLVFY